MEEYLNETFNHLSRVLNTDKMSIQFIDEHGYYIFKKWRAISDVYRNAVKDLHLWKPSIKHFEPIFIKDTLIDYRFKKIREVVKKEKIKSIIILPLVFNNKLIGRFAVYFPCIHKFSEWEIQLLKTTARAISILLEKVKYRNELNKADIFLLRERNNELFKTIETIHSKESILQEACEIAELGIWEFIIELDELKCSEELLCMLGIKPEKKYITFGELLDTIYLDDIEIINNAFTDAINNKKKSELIIRHIKNDNSAKYLQIKIKPMLKKGKVDKLIGTAWDITSFKRKEIEIYNALLHEKEMNRQNSQANLTNIHELHKYLIDISAAMNILVLDLKSSSNNEKTRYFNDRHNSINNIYDIINSLKTVNTSLIQRLHNSSETISLSRGDKEAVDNDTKVIKYANSNKKINSNQVLIEIGKKSKLIKIDDIEYITTLGNYTNLYVLNEGKITVRKILKDWLKILPEMKFLRIHRSHAINLDHIQEIEKWYNSSFRIKMKYSKTSFIASNRYSKLIRKKLKY